MRAKLKYYREQVENLRQLADRTREAELKETLLGAAREYGKLAEKARQVN